MAAWCGIAAAAFDLVQNIALATVLDSGAHSPWPRVAQVCGTLTFLLAICALGSAIKGALAARSHAQLNT